MRHPVLSVFPFYSRVWLLQDGEASFVSTLIPFLFVIMTVTHAAHYVSRPLK